MYQGHFFRNVVKGPLRWQWLLYRSAGGQPRTLCRYFNNVVSDSHQTCAKPPHSTEPHGPKALAFFGTV